MDTEVKYDINQVYELFDGRMSAAQSGDKLDAPVVLKFDKEILTDVATSDMPEIVNKAQGIHKGDPQNTVTEWRSLDPTLKTPAAKQELREIHNFTLGFDSRIRFLVTKRFLLVHDHASVRWGTYPPHPPGEESESILFKLFDEDSEIGCYRIDKGADWALNDRYVVTKYRNQGFGAALLETVKLFMQSQADLQKTPQKLTANVGQPNVLLRFLNHEFGAASPEDQEKIDMVLLGHEDLELDFAVLTIEDGTLKVEHEKDIYCFKKGVTPKTEVNAFRINLVKIFKPKNSAVDVAIREVKGACDDSGFC